MLGGLIVTPQEQTINELATNEVVSELENDTRTVALLDDRGSDDDREDDGPGFCN